MTRRRRTVAVCVALAGLVAFALFCYNYRATYICDFCLSSRRVSQWHVGSWTGWSRAVSPKWEQVHETQLWRHLFAPGHKHVWELLGGQPYHFFGTVSGGCAVGGARRNMNEFCRMYEGSPQLQKLVQTKIENGSISKETILGIVELDFNYFPENSPDTTVSELIELAKSPSVEAGL
jgi:hypothetical protein